MTSFMSKIALCYFRLNGYKKKVSKPETRAEYIEKLRIINTQRVEAPPKGIRSDIRLEMIADTETYFLNNGKDKVMLYLHGGSYCEQPVIQHWQFCDRVAMEADITSVMAVYPKAPDNTFERTFDYLEELWGRLLKAARTEDIVLAGDSSGGGLALAFAEYLKEKGMPQPGQLILFSPWVDISMETAIPVKLARTDPTLSVEWLRNAGKNWAGDTDVHDYRLSPINGDLGGLAPMTVYYGTHEIFILDGRRLKERCDRDGARIRYTEGEKMNHCYPLFPIPEARKIRHEIVRMIKDM